MILKINPTRMELLRLQKRYALAKRGHKLLKDKLEGLMKTFLKLTEQYSDYRQQINRELPAALAEFMEQTATYPVEVVELLSRTTSTKFEVNAATRNVMNLSLPMLSFSISDFESPSFSGLEGVGVEAALLRLYAVVPVIVKLAEIEAGIRLMADEIEKTRRRVNALEYVMIPNLEETIRYISSKLDENERATLTRLLKIKGMIQAH